MIRWTKDGKVYRSASLQPWHSREECVIGGLETYGALCHDLADALDVAVAALRWYADPVAYSMPVRDMNHHVFPDMGATAKKALRQIGAEHDRSPT